MLLEAGYAMNYGCPLTVDLWRGLERSGQARYA